MASSSREDPSRGGGGGGGGGGSDRRYPHSLQGLLTFSAENTAPGGTTANTDAVLDPERQPRTANDIDKGNDPELARTNQDKALQVLGLHRYRIAGDGNCLFRAVSKQLNLEQQKFHPMLRRAAVKWMRENKHELLEWGLLDGEKEINETEEEGTWPGQAAIVALANILGINVAVIQGGDKGDIDIQHICPFETPIDKEQGSIILAYLYNGHYDAVVEEANMANPEFDKWVTQRNKEYEADEALARRLAAEEGEVPVKESLEEAQDHQLALKLAESASEDLARRLADEDYMAAFGTTTTTTSTTSTTTTATTTTGFISENKPQEPRFRHVSHIKVNYSQPSGSENKPTHSLAKTQYGDLVCLSNDKHNMKSSKNSKSPMSEGDFSLRSKPSPNVHRGGPVPPPRSRPIRSYSEDDAPTLKLTLYPKQPLNERDINKGTIRSTPGSEELIVSRKTPTNNALRERQFSDNSIYDNSPPTYRTHRQGATAPTVRIIPIEYTGDGRGSESIDRRVAVKRREYAQHGSSSSWSHSPPEYSRSIPQRELFRKSPTDMIRRSPTGYSPEQNTSHKPHHAPHTRVYALSDDPVSRDEDLARYRAEPNQKPKPSSSHGCFFPMSDDSYNSTDTIRSQRSEPRARPPVMSKSREVPVVVLRPSLMPHPSHARATPAPVTLDLDKDFQRPPQLQLFKPNMGDSLLERSLRRRDFWL